MHPISTTKTNPRASERRRSVRRHASNLDLFLDIDGASFIKGRIRDLSYEGLFIETTRNLMQPDNRVELLLNFEGEICRAEVTVVRATSTGVGVKMDREAEHNFWFVYNFLPTT